MNDRLFFACAKGVAYPLILVAWGVILVRGIVSPLWASMTDLGMAGAIGAAVIGAFATAWITARLWADLVRAFAPPPPPPSTSEGEDQ